MNIWIGFRDPHAALVEETERLLRTTGHDVTWRSYPELPAGDYVETLLSRAEAQNDVVAWVLEDDEASQQLEETLRGRSGADYRLFLIRESNLYIDGDTEPLGPATANGDTAFAFSRALIRSRDC